MTSTAAAAAREALEREPRGVFGRRRTPLALQVAVLLFTGLVIAQAAAVAVVVLLPPDRPVYRADEVAAALKGQPLPKRPGQALVRTVDVRPLERTGLGWVSFRPLRQDLAAALGVKTDDVYLRVYFPPPFAGVGFGPRPSGRRRAPDGPSRDAPGRSSDEVRARSHGGFHDSFVAAWRRGDGRWVNVTPAPDRFLSAWQWRVLTWFLAAFAVLGPIGYLFARRLAAPINAFARAADALGRDPRTPLPPLDGPAEIGLAARAFNRMQARLQRYVEDRTAMVGAISHDLRTPLSRIRFKLEGAPPDLRASVLSDVGQMEEMISSVLAFIRDGAEPGRRERIDLRSLIECEVDEAAMVGGAVALEPGESPTIEADAIGVQRVVANLIGNAVKYGGRADVRMRVASGEAVIEIADDGPGLAPAEMERVFRPFYRAESARTLDSGGIGLGLAVARSIARAHGGDVRLMAAADGVSRSPLPARGLVAEIRLPLAPAAG